MRLAISRRIVLILIMVSYLLIFLMGEHIGGFVGSLLYFSFFNDPDLLFTFLPVVGLIIFTTIFFLNSSLIFFILAFACLYIPIIVQFTEIFKIGSFLSAIPFFVLSIIGLFIEIRIKKNKKFVSHTAT